MWVFLVVLRKVSELENAQQLREQMFGDQKDCVHIAAANALFSEFLATNVQQEETRQGLEIVSSVGYISGEHNVVFCSLYGKIGDVPVEGRLRVKDDISIWKKGKRPDYQDASGYPIIPADLLGITLIIGDEKEEENEIPDMDAEANNVANVADVMRRIVTVVGFEGAPQLNFLVAASRKEEGHAVHVRGDQLYIDSVMEKTGFNPMLTDVVMNKDHSFQVSKVTLSVDLPQRSMLVHTEVQVTTRTARKNSRDGDGAHWLYRKNEAKKMRMTDGDPRKHYNVLTVGQRRMGSAYIKELKRWFGTDVTKFDTMRHAEDFCRRMNIGIT